MSTARTGCTWRRVARARTSSCCMDGHCMAACGDPWLDALAQRARLHIVDLPGHGRSPWHDDLTDLPRLAREVSAVVPAGAAVLGWSLGGMVALEIARSRPG